MSAPKEALGSSPEWMARYTAVYAIGRLPVASWLLAELARGMLGHDQSIDPGEAGCWGDAILWILQQVDDDANEARSAAVAAGWMDQDGGWVA